MKIPTFAILFACAIWCGGVRAQSIPPPPPEIERPAQPPPPETEKPAQPPLPQTERPAQPAPPADSPDMQTDRFTASREAADMRQAAYVELDKRNMAEIDRLMRTKRCQFNRITPLLDDTIQSMNNWLEAEKKYWNLWNDAEGARVEDMRTTLASLEADAVRIAKLVDTETEGLQELSRQRAILEVDKRTVEIVAKIDGVVKDIRDSEARLDHARQELDSVTARIRDLKASISTRLVRIRENLVKLESWQVDQSAYYAERRTSAHDVCQVAHPAETAIPAGRKKADQ